MPLYNQNASVFEDLFPHGNPGESKLCVPTSAAMVLSTLTLDGLSYRARSWTARHFVYRSPEARIRALVERMDTQPEHGTPNGSETSSRAMKSISSGKATMTETVVLRPVAV